MITRLHAAKAARVRGVNAVLACSQNPQAMWPWLLIQALLVGLILLPALGKLCSAFPPVLPTPGHSEHPLWPKKVAGLERGGQRGLLLAVPAPSLPHCHIFSHLLSSNLLSGSNLEDPALRPPAAAELGRVNLCSVLRKIFQFPLPHLSLSQSTCPYTDIL